MTPAQEADRMGGRWRNIGLAVGLAGLVLVAFDQLGFSLLAFCAASLCLQEASACFGWRTGYLAAQIHTAQDQLCPVCRGPNQRRYPGQRG